MIEYYDRQGNPITQEQWLDLMKVEDQDEWIRMKRVALTDITDDIYVSTVWLGLNHNWNPDGPPLIFETMVFGGPMDSELWRCSTEAQAVEQHGFVVGLVRRDMEVMSSDGQDPDRG